MFNDQENARLSREGLEKRLVSYGGLSKDEWQFDISYNHDEKIFSLFQVYRQRQSESVSIFWNWLSGLWPAPEWFQEKALDMAARVDQAQAVRDADLRSHIQRYKSLLMEGNRVLVVGHSQGNFYANSAYTNLAQDDSNLPMSAFGIVAVATPSGLVAGGGPHITRTDDLVINSVRFFFWGTLAGNVTNSNDTEDWKSHSFIDAYLKGDQSGPMIVNAALATADSLAWPEAEYGSGPITVTLTWGAQPDVDLHVFEPDGSHVYYASPVGTSGYLDYDDVTSYGPEHYYVVDCEDLAVGTYRVGVNYYRGSAPETAYVQIQAGEVVRSYLTDLSQAEGSAGNANPEGVADIEVAEDDNGNYTFTVRQL
ncbi:MAG: hypothetical protein RQ723_13005 [Desulfuromonadales bacterium]|nr:hypothetical protein [Desulfuromonadales bacterium]